MGESEATASFLEVGCGQGALGARLSRVFNYVAYEPDVASFRVAEKRLRFAGSGRILNSFLPNSPDRQFDNVGAFEVLEHIEDDLEALRMWRGWIRPGGRLLLSVPAWPHRFGPGDEAVGHFRRYEPEQLKHVVGEAGYGEIEVVMYGFPLGYLLEATRDRIAGGRTNGPMDERTAASGRSMQPGIRLGALTRPATLPFRVVQRAFRATPIGTGLVLAARRPM